MPNGLRWGILGTANIARRRFVPGVRASGAGTVVAIGGRDLARTEAFARELGIPHALGSYEAVLVREDVDAVYVPLPNGLHPEWVQKAAATGKHVWCEKPLAPSLAEAEAMAAACERAGVLLLEGFMYRLHPQYARVAELLQQGTIGELRTLRAAFWFLLTPQRRAAGDVRVAANLAGGSLLDVGCYTINVARLLMGDEPTAVAGRRWMDPRYGVDTRGSAILEFPGARLAQIDYGFDAAYLGRCELHGTEGNLVLERAFNAQDQPAVLRLHRNGLLGRLGAASTTIEELPPADPFALQAAHFAASVEAGHLLPPAENGVSQARVVERLLRAP